MEQVSQPASISDVSQWRRGSRGKELQFYASDTEVQDWLIRSLPAEYGPYLLVGGDLLAEGSRYVSVPFKCRVSELVACRVGCCAERWQFWIWSEPLSPGLELQRGEQIDTICSYNGLVLLQHGRESVEGRESSRIAVVTTVHNLSTGELRHYQGYEHVFSALRKTIEKSLRYDTVLRFADGQEEKSRIVRWTEGATDEYRAGVRFARARPGDLLRSP